MSIRAITAIITGMFFHQAVYPQFVDEPSLWRPGCLTGAVFDDESDMGFAEYVGGVLMMRDHRPGKWDDGEEEFPDISDMGLCLSFHSTDTERPREARNFRVFLIRKLASGQRPFEIMDELDIDRESDHEYIYEDIRYEYEGRDYLHSSLICYDPAADAIRQWYAVDIENPRFIPLEPLPGMTVVWQEP